MKKSLALIMSLIMIFSTFSIFAVSANASTAAPAAVASEQEDDIQLESQFSLLFRSFFRTFTNGMKKRMGNSNMSVTGVDITIKDKAISAGKNITLIVELKPEDAKNKKVIWAASDYNVVSVSSKGVVTGKRAGTATIYAIAEDGGFYDTCKITVNGSNSGYVSCTGLAVEKSSVSLKKGTSTTVKITKSPSNTNDTITLYNSNANIVKVSLDSSNNLVIKAVSKGTATITVNCGSKTKTINVTVSLNVHSNGRTYHGVKSTEAELKSMGCTSIQIVSLKSIDPANSGVTYGQYAYCKGCLKECTKECDVITSTRHVKFLFHNPDKEGHYLGETANGCNNAKKVNNVNHGSFTDFCNGKCSSFGLCSGHKDQEAINKTGCDNVIWDALTLEYKCGGHSVAYYCDGHQHNAAVNFCGGY